MHCGDSTCLFTNRLPSAACEPQLYSSLAGPSAKWLDQAKANADLIFSGSETMMTDFVYAMDGQLSHQQVTPLYLRPLSILVRPGNPKHTSRV